MLPPSLLGQSAIGGIGRVLERRAGGLHRSVDRGRAAAGNVTDGPFGGSSPASRGRPRFIGSMMRSAADHVRTAGRR
jgi:hypothetical protein